MDKLVFPGKKISGYLSVLGDNAEELKYKESNRIVAIVDNLTKMGVDIAATDDGIVMMGLAAQNVDAGDHRMAMALAVAA